MQVIYAHDSASVQIHSSTFQSNFAGSNGGAINVYDGVNVEIHHSIFHSNSAGKGGGAINAYTSQGAKVEIHSSIFHSNAASSRLYIGNGGAISADSTNVEIHSSTFKRNYAAIGGAIYAALSRVEVHGTLFDSNSGSSTGGAVFLTDCTSQLSTLTNCTFQNNKAGSEGGDGAHSGGAFFGVGSNIQIIQSTLKLNQSDTIHAEAAGNVLIDSSTIVVYDLSVGSDDSDDDAYDDDYDYDDDGGNIDDGGPTAIYVQDQVNLTIVDSVTTNAVASSQRGGSILTMLNFTGFVLKVNQTLFDGPLRLVLDSSSISGAAVFDNCSFKSQSIIKNVASDKSGTNKLFLRQSHFEEGSNMTGSYADCAFQDESMVRTSTVCGPLTSCRYYEQGPSVECFCPGSGSKRHLESNIVLGMVPAFRCQCTNSKAGLQCSEGVNNLTNGFFHNNLLPPITGTHTWRAVASITSSTNFQYCPSIGLSDKSQCQINNITAAVTCIRKSAGPLCGACVPGYYKTEHSGECFECSSFQTAGHQIVVLACLAVAFVVVYSNANTVFFQCKRFWGKVCGLQDMSTFVTEAQQQSLLIKLRLLLSCMQVIGLMGNVYSIRYPQQLLSITHVFNFASADLSALLNLSCIRGVDNADSAMRLITSVTLGLGLLLSMIQLALWRIKWKYRHQLDRRPLEILVASSFLVHPYLCTIIFGTFSCIDVPLGDGTHRYLFASMHVDCASTEHLRAVKWASVMVIVFPLGIPLLWGLAHNKIDSRVLAPLFRGFKPGRWWWAIVDATFKVFVTGFAVLIEQGSVMQLVFAIMVTVVYLALLLLYDPLQDRTDGLLQAFFAIILIFSFVGSLMLQLVDVQFGETSTTQGYTESGATALILSLAAAVFVAFGIFASIDFYAKREAAERTREEEEEVAQRKRERVYHECLMVRPPLPFTSIDFRTLCSAWAAAKKDPYELLAAVLRVAGWCFDAPSATSDIWLATEGQTLLHRLGFAKQYLFELPVWDDHSFKQLQESASAAKQWLVLTKVLPVFEKMRWTTRFGGTLSEDLIGTEVLDFEHPWHKACDVIRKNGLWPVIRVLQELRREGLTTHSERGEHRMSSTSTPHALDSVPFPDEVAVDNWFKYSIIALDIVPGALRACEAEMESKLWLGMAGWRS
jgi:hypothetical protein